MAENFSVDPTFIDRGEFYYGGPFPLRLLPNGIGHALLVDDIFDDDEDDPRPAVCFATSGTLLIEPDPNGDIIVQIVCGNEECNALWDISDPL